MTRIYYHRKLDIIAIGSASKDKQFWLDYAKYYRTKKFNKILKILKELEDWIYLGELE